jgi:hypothetical protein
MRTNYSNRLCSLLLMSDNPIYGATGAENPNENSVNVTLPPMALEVLSLTVIGEMKVCPGGGWSYEDAFVGSRAARVGGHGGRRCVSGRR